MSPQATPAHPGIAKADTERRTQVERLELKRLQDLQTQVARNRRIQKAARRDPATEALLEEHTALQVTVDALRTQLAELDEKSRLLLSEKAALQVERDSLKARLDEQITDGAKLAADVKKLGEDLEAARSDAGKARAELAKLKDKKA